VIGSPARRRATLAVLVLVIVACLGTIALVVTTRGAGDGLGDRLSSLQDDEVPGATDAKDREQLLTLSRQFATRFNTYDPSMLDDAGKLPEYADVADLMTPKFAEVFSKNIGYAEATVAQTGAASEGTVYAVGVDSVDGDSAEVLVAGTIELSYPLPEGQQGQGDDSGDDSGDPATGEDRISSGPQRFRYQVSLVKIDGNWLVDDLDDIDDGLPPFSQPSIPEDPQGQPPATDPTGAPSGAPTTGSVDPSQPATEEGEE